MYDTVPGTGYGPSRYDGVAMTYLSVEKYIRDLKAAPPGTWDYPSITQALSIQLGCPDLTPVDEDDPSKGDYNAALINDDVCQVVGAIKSHRPPFLSGRCPAQDGILSVPLPDDVGFSP